MKAHNPVTAIALAAALFSVLCSPLMAEPTNVSIVHVNDTHGFVLPFDYEDDGVLVGGAPRWQTILAEARESNPNTLFLHAGDAVVGSGDKYRINWEQPNYLMRGLLQLEVVNWLGCDAMVLGNHEFDFGRRWLDTLLKVPEFPVLSANLLEWQLPEVDRPHGELIGQPYVILQAGATRVGMIGLTTFAYMESSQVKVEDHIEVAMTLVPEVRRQADIVVVLSHLGHNRDLRLAREVSGIDAIIGGHSHTFLPVPVIVGDTIVTQAGEYGVHVGKLDLVVDDGDIVDYTYELIHADEHVVGDPDVEMRIRSALDVGVLVGGPLEASDERQSSLGALVTEAALSVSGADIAVVTSGTMAGTLAEGVVSVDDLTRVFWPMRARTRGPEKDLRESQLSRLADNTGHALPPWAFVGNSDGLETLVEVEIAGSELKELLEEGLARHGSEEYLQVSRSELFRVTADGILPLAGFSPGQLYTVVVNLSLALGEGEYAAFMQERDKIVLETEVFEAVLHYMRSEGSISAPDMISLSTGG